MTRPLSIVLFGPESTGKTVLAQQLAKHYNTLWNPEYVRVFLDIKKEVGLLPQVETHDLPAIAFGQLSSEKNVSAQASKLVFFDTNLLEHLIYVRGIFGKKAELPWLEKAIAQQKYDLYLFTQPDIPFTKDTQRDTAETREEFYHLMKQELEKRALPHTEISGSYEERFEKSTQAIANLLENQ